MKNLISIVGCTIILALFFLGGLAPYAQAKALTAEVTAALIVKLVSFEKKIGGGGEVTIHVIGAPDVAAELKKAIGREIGSSTLKNVNQSDGIPATPPTILYVGNAGAVAGALSFSREKKIMTISGIPGLTQKGITLGLELGDDGKPKIVLNLTSSKEEGLDWNPAIMKIAKTTE